MGRKANVLTKDFILKKVKVDSNGCWIWQGHTVRGYGSISVRKVRYRPHRVALHLWKGFDLASELFACHHCDVRACCNPEHLFIGTNSDNCLDAVRKGRWVDNSGSKHGNAIITEDDVLLMDALYAAGWSHPTIAEALDVSYGTVRNVIPRNSWKHVPKFDYVKGGTNA